MNLLHRFSHNATDTRDTHTLNKNADLIDWLNARRRVLERIQVD